MYTGYLLDYIQSLEEAEASISEPIKEVDASGKECYFHVFGKAKADRGNFFGRHLIRIFNIMGFYAKADYHFHGYFPTREEAQTAIDEAKVKPEFKGHRFDICALPVGEFYGLERLRPKYFYNANSEEVKVKKHKLISNEVWEGIQRIIETGKKLKELK